MTFAEARSRRLAALMVLAAFPLAVAPARAQYDWSRHTGTRPTGFEAVRFGAWDLELLSLRGMVDRHFYESGALFEASVQSISESTSAVGPDGEPAGPAFRRSRADVDRHGRVRRIEYLDPLTKRVVQRETFSYNEEGHLEEWSRSRPASEVAVASLTRTEYPGSPPYGMAQTFAYHEDGGLKEWRACTVTVSQRLQDCEEDYLRLDAAGRIAEFGWSGEVTRLVRDVEGNTVSIEILNTGSGESTELKVSWEGGVRLETRGEEIVGRSYYDDQGRLVQYQSVSSGSPDYYATVSWTYDANGRVASVSRAFDSHEFARDEAGRLVEVSQTVTPRSVRRRYDAQGRLVEQQPPLFFRRMSPMSEGSEAFAYGPDGLLTGIAVRDESGATVAETVFDYSRRGRSSGVSRN